VAEKMQTKVHDSMISQNSPFAQPSRAWQISNLALLVVVMVLLVGFTGRVVYGMGTQAAMFNHPFQFDESEGMIVAETMLMDRGVNIFDPVTPDLFIAAPYPPVYYLLTWPFQHLLGNEPSFKIGRALSLLSTLLAGVAIYGIMVALARNKIGGAVAAIAFWSLGPVTFWGSLVKPDMLALALGLWGLWWLVARPPSQMCWALPLFLLAFYTKQTSIAAAVAGTSWLLFTRPRTGLGFGAAYGLGLVVPSLLLNWTTNGGYFYHMFTLHSLPWFPNRFEGFLQSLFVDFGPFLVPGLVAIMVVAAMWLRRRDRRENVIIGRDGEILLLLYLVMSVLVASGVGTLGGNHNHLLDLLAALCLGLGMGCSVLLSSPAWQWKAVGVLAGLIAVSWIPSLFSVPLWLQVQFNQLKPEPTEGMMHIFQYVTNNGGEAYSDNVGLMVATHKRLWSTDPYTQTHATSYGRWDQSKLLAAIAMREFSQIILRIDVDEPQAGAGDVSPEILQAVRDNYKLDQHNVLNIYVPR
jgi:hypothetical protein